MRLRRTRTSAYRFSFKKGWQVEVCLDRATAVSGLVGGLELRLVREVKRVGPEIDKNDLFLIYTFIS